MSNLLGLSSRVGIPQIGAIIYSHFHRNTERPTALVFCHNSYRDSEKFLDSIFSHVCFDGKRPFHCAVICSDVLEESSDDHQGELSLAYDACLTYTSDLLDLRHSSEDLAESRQRHASVWTRLSGGGLVTTIPTVRGTVDHIYGMNMDMIAFVVGSSYLAGMMRQVLSSRQQQLC